MENIQAGGYVHRSGLLLKLTIFQLCPNATLAAVTFEKVITICSLLLSTSDGGDQFCFLKYL
jgi:hypothetical protein